MNAEPKNEVVAATSPAGMSIILDLAKDPSMDVEKLKALVDMQKDLLDRQAEKAFAVAFVAMKPHLRRIENKHKNSQTNSLYAKLEDINGEINPILEQFGFASLTPVIAQTEKTVTVVSKLLHKDGHCDEAPLTMPLDLAGIKGTVNKTEPHAIASSIKYCRRIAVCAHLNISTGDGADKDGNQVSNFINIEQAADIDLRLRAISDKALPNFLKWAKVEHLTDIQTGNYSVILKGLINMEEEAKAKVKA